MIVILGATGTVGSAVARRLGRDGVRARLVVRNANGLGEKSVHAVATADFSDPASLEAAFAGGTRLFLMSPAAAELVTWEMAALAAARRAGVAEIVLLSVAGASPAAGSALLRAHAEAEAALAAVNGPAWTVLRPSFFLQGLLPSIRATLASGSWRAPAATGAAAWVDVRDVAAAAARLLRDGVAGGAHAGRIYTVTGPEALTFRQLAVTLSVVAGRRITVEPQSPEPLREALLAGGRSPWLAAALADLYAALEAGDMATVTSDLPEITGRVPLSFAQWLRDTRALWMEPSR